MTQISIDIAKNQITDIVYQKKIELYGKNLPLVFLHNNIDEVEKIYNLPKNYKITKTLISQRISKAEHSV